MVSIRRATFLLRRVSPPVGPDFQVHSLRSQSQLFCSLFASLQAPAQAPGVPSSSENPAT